VCVHGWDIIIIIFLNKKVKNYGLVICHSHGRTKEEVQW
jgi:hypothetical protein